MPNNLTPEQIANGWQDYKTFTESLSEKEVKSKEGLLFQILEPRPFGAFKVNTFTDWGFTQRIELDDVTTCFYRRLIPALPNQVVISREDAEFIIREMRFRNGSLTENQELYWDNLQAKLEGK